ncbi:MAG TPA: ankyrin repeat domain-containing protein [Gammaproteobacteria bacterium]|nr:ankyrin repeat domain-containing protein [Gammaproteobacteria bacterium]
MLTSQIQNTKTTSLETKNELERQAQASTNVNAKKTQTLSLIEAIKENNQTEFFRLLNLKTNPLGKKLIDEADAEWEGSPLYWAAAYGHTHLIMPLIKAGADIHKQDKDGRTPLYKAAFNGHAAAIIALHAAGADVNAQNKNGCTPVYAAACDGHTEAIVVLTALGANVNTPEKDGWTPICTAARDGHAEAIVALHAAGANVNTPTTDGWTPVFGAASKGHAEAIAALHAAGANMDIYNTYIAAQQGDSKTITNFKATGVNLDLVLLIAAATGHVAAITALHAAGANINTSNNDSETPVYIAAQNGRAEAIRTLHALGANINTPNKDSVTPVYIAAENGHTDAIRALHALGAYVNTLGKDGWTPVCIAAQNGHAEAIAALKAAGADVNTPHNEGWTPVFVAASEGQAEAIRSLHAAGANADTSIPDLCHTAVYVAAEKGHVAAIAALHAAGANMNTPSIKGWTPVSVAASNGHVEAIRALHAAGANMNTPNNDSVTPVLAAAASGQAAAIAALHVAGANVNTPRPDGKVPVFIAASEGHAEAITALHAAGANVNTPDNDGITPVYAAASNGHVLAIATLKAAGANVNTPMPDGITPVFLAAQQGHATAIAALHAAGANVNTPNNDGITPVYAAASNGHAATITALKAAGANVNTPTNDGWTPVSIAASEGHAEAIAALHAAGANVNTPNNDGITPVYAAASNGHAAAIAALHALGANMNAPRDDGETPIYAAASEGHAVAIKALLESGANANVKKKKSGLLSWGTTTALEQAKKGKEPGHIEVVRLLEAHLKQYPNGIKPAPMKAIATNKEVNQTLISTPLSPIHEVKTIHDSPAASKKLPPPRPPQSPLASKDATNSVVSPDSLLQSLQIQLMTEKQETPSLSASHTPTDIKTSLETLTHDLEETQKEKQSLGQTSHELKTQSKRLQETLQKEITAQESEHVHLEQQQEAFQKQIADLEKSLAQKSGIEQQAIQTRLETTQEQLLVVQTQQAILWNEHEIKSQKREALKRFQSHPNLLLFYRTFHIKLEEIFISFKAVSGGFVNPVNGDVAIAKSIFDALGDAVSIAPIVGTSIQKILKWSVSNGLKKIDRTRQKNTAINASGLVTLSEVKKYAESIARQLTERYADQLERLATPEQEQADASKFKQGLAKMKETVLKGAVVPSSKKLAAFGVLWIIDQLYDSEALDESKELDEALLLAISQKPLPNKLKEFWQEITTTLGLEGVRSKNGEIWHPASVYTLAGLRVGNEYYSSQKLEPQTYGWRSGTLQEVEALGLKKVQAPTTQAFAIEHQKVAQSISVVHKNVQQMQQETKQHGEELETVRKMLDIAGNAQLRALQADLAKEKKDKEALNQRLEKLEKSYPRSVSPAPQRRSSGIKNFTKQSEQENILEALKELRKFFLGQRDKGEESTNIAIYEKYLKMANKDAELIYQQEDRVHVLCIDGDVLDRAAAAQTIGNMIKALDSQTQSTAPAAHQLRQPDSHQPSLGTDSNRLGSAFKRA